ncbi:MAG TPA: sulfatase-like hydrolase/transferase [Rubrobacteraceae bacterium]|nr:sulfatase-like hydrolase/transferase [Rubrobacteraceae bacterium]
MSGVLFLAMMLALFSSCGDENSADDPQVAAAERSVSDIRLEETPHTEKRNVVLILLESFRARSVTPYNPDLQTTPFLDELAGESLLAGRAYTIVPHTTKALVAAECGIEPHLVQEITESTPDGIPARCLAELLGEQGYESAFFQPGGVDWEGRPQLVENFGHDDLISLEDMNTEGFQMANYFGYEDDIMLEPSRLWLQQHGDEPFFVTYKTLTPHHDYETPQRYGIENFVEDDMLNGYLNSVRYVDFFLKNLFDQYKEMGLYEDTIFVFYGDHGEGFMEHGRTQHDNTIWEEGLKVPLMVHDPQRWENGRRVDELADLTDIAPTVVDLLGYDVVGGEYPGYSLRDLPEDRTLKFSCWYDDKCVASLRGETKYIHHFDERPDQVFDLRRDPLEKNNLAKKRPELVEKRREELFEWREENDELYGR